MSQIFKPLTSAGPIPPIIPTSFVTQDGTAVPAANILIIDGFDSSENNDNGIITKGGVVGTGTANEVDVVITNRGVATGTTNGAVTTSVTLFTPTNATAFTYKAYITGRETTTGDCAGGSIEGLARKNAGAVTVVGDSDTLDEEDVSLIGVDWNIVASGADLVIQFIGIAATTINWKCTFTYQQVRRRS